MSQESARIVQKLWSYCNLLRDDGLSYQDYLEQLTTLLFLKMSEERGVLTGEEQPIPKGHRWSDLAAPQMEGARLEDHYRESLKELGKQSGMLGLVFRKAQNKIQESICDPACGTGGFLLSVHDYISHPEMYTLDRDQKRHLRYDALRGVELVDGVAQLCVMNLFLHGIGRTTSAASPRPRPTTPCATRPPSTSTSSSPIHHSARSRASPWSTRRARRIARP